MKGCLVAQLRMTHHLTLVIDCASVVSRDSATPPEVAEVRHRALLPKQCVILHEIEPTKRVERPASARRADSLTLVVDKSRDSIRVARICAEFLDHGILPDDRLKLEDGTARGRVRGVSLCKPGYFASIVDAVREAIGASQCRKLCHHALLPQEGETCGN